MQISPTTGTAIEAIGSEGGVGCNVLRWSPMTPEQPTFQAVVTKDGIPCNSRGSAVAVSPTGTLVLIGAAGVVARSTDDGVAFAASSPHFTGKVIPGTFNE